jgi:hypothetical protein
MLFIQNCFWVLKPSYPLMTEMLLICPLNFVTLAVLPHKQWAQSWPIHNIFLLNQKGGWKSIFSSQTILGGGVCVSKSQGVDGPQFFCSISSAAMRKWCVSTGGVLEPGGDFLVFLRPEGVKQIIPIFISPIAFYSLSADAPSEGAGMLAFYSLCLLLFLLLWRLLQRPHSESPHTKQNCITPEISGRKVGSPISNIRTVTHKNGWAAQRMGMR